MLPREEWIKQYWERRAIRKAEAKKRWLEKPREVRTGEHHPSSKYPDSLVETVKGLHKTGDYGYTKLAKMFNVPRSTIKAWVRGLRRQYGSTTRTEAPEAVSALRQGRDDEAVPKGDP